MESFQTSKRLENWLILKNWISITSDPTTKRHALQALNKIAPAGHTSWATHGKPTELNAHPHLGESSYVVHNGIIENYATLKKELQSSGITFLSQTDTEVIVHQFEKNLKISNNPFEAFAKTVKELHGAYAILLVTKA